MIDVAAAIIYDEQGRILICKRQKGGECAGLWEFPGGKKEEGESMPQCLVRECWEELEAEIEVGELFDEFVYTYPTRTIHFCFYMAHLASRKISLNVHSKIEWVTPLRLGAYSFCPADERIVCRLIDKSI